MLGPSAPKAWQLFGILPATRAHSLLSLALHSFLPPKVFAVCFHIFLCCHHSLLSWLPLLPVFPLSILQGLFFYCYCCHHCLHFYYDHFFLCHCCCLIFMLPGQFSLPMIKTTSRQEKTTHKKPCIGSDNLV
jgi:hypothetical protein